MKKTIMSIMIALFLLNISSFSFAASYGKSMGASNMVVEGTIVSVDKAKNQFTIKDDDDGREVTIQAWASDIAKLSQSAHVKVTLSQFSNRATTIR